MASSSPRLVLTHRNTSLKVKLDESRAQTTKLEAQLAQALADAEAEAKEQADAAEANAQLLQAQRGLDDAAARVAAFDGKKDKTKK